jgi:hypothetical protein
LEEAQRSAVAVCALHSSAVGAACLAPLAFSPGEPQEPLLATRRQTRRVRSGASRTRSIARRSLLVPQSRRTPESAAHRRCSASRTILSIADASCHAAPISGIARSPGIYSPSFLRQHFPKAAAKPSAMDRPACSRDSRRSNCQLFRSWWKLPAGSPRAADTRGR